MPGRPNRILSDIARWNLELHYRQIPESCLEKARCQFLSVLASVYAGRHLEESQSVLRSVGKLYQGREATILATGEKSSVEGAVLANASLSMAHDFDDYLFMGHTGHSAVLVSLALCEALDKKVSDLVACQVAANEIAGRLGASALLGPLNGQMWSFIHLASACCVAGRLRRLTRDQMENALAIALSMPPYPMQEGFFATGAKLLTASWPAILGVQAAVLASEGMTGPRGVLDQDGGFYEVFSYHPIRGAWEGLGTSWVTESLAIKLYPGCAYLDSALDALERILGRVEAERGQALAPSDIDRIIVRATLVTQEMERLSRLFGAGSLHPTLLNFSVRYSFAWRLLQGSLSPRELTREAVRRREAELRSLAGRIHLVPDTRLNSLLIESLVEKAGLGRIVREMGVRGIASVLRKASDRYAIADLLSGERTRSGQSEGAAGARKESRGRARTIARLASSVLLARSRRFSLGDLRPEEFEFPFGSRVLVYLKDGSVFEDEQQVPTGAPGNRSVDLISVAGRKFRVQAEGLLGEARTEEVLAALLGAGPETSVRSLLRLLRGEGKGVRRGTGKAGARNRHEGGGGKRK